jgi:hypothetical protein
MRGSAGNGVLLFLVILLLILFPILLFILLLLFACRRLVYPSIEK